MEKVEVGYNWECPEELSEIGRIGGYVIAEDEDGLYVCGREVFNFSSAPVMSCMIMPATKEYIDKGVELSDNPNAFGKMFEIEDKIYYLVTYGEDENDGSGTYIFEEFSEALNLVGMLATYKGDSLKLNLSERQNFIAPDEPWGDASAFDLPEGADGLEGEDGVALRGKAPTPPAGRTVTEGNL